MEHEASKKTTTIEEEEIKMSPSNPTAPVVVAQKYKSLRRLWGSRKLWMTLIAMFVNFAAYILEVQYLKGFTQPEQILAFAGMTRDFHWVVAAGLMAYLGVQGAVEWRHGTSTVINQAASFLKEDKEQDITYTERIIRDDDEGAPALKPFGRQAVGQ